MRLRELHLGCLRFPSLSLSLCPSWGNRDPIALENSNSTTNRLGTSPGIGNPESLNSIRQKGWRIERVNVPLPAEVRRPLRHRLVNFSFSSSPSRPKINQRGAGIRSGE